MSEASADVPETPSDEPEKESVPTTDVSANAAQETAASVSDEADVPAETAAAAEAVHSNIVPKLAPPAPASRFDSKGLAPLAVGIVGAFILMSKTGQLRFGVPLGFVFVAIAAFGVMKLLRSFEKVDDDAPAQQTSWAALRTPIVRTLALGLAFLGSLALAQWRGALTPWLWGVFVTASFIAFVASLFDVGFKFGPWRLDELGEERRLLHRHGFWVVVMGALLYFPGLGVFSLWDPWETHYGEVAREVLARDDWISLWWAQEQWFWSKPILNFWIQSIAMGTLGTHYQPDMMLLGVGPGMAHPEWVVRTPNVLLTIFAMYAIYKGVAKGWGRRAGFLGAFVLGTMPDWYFLAHQTMTDMPFVAAMTAVMGFVLLGLHTTDDVKVKDYELKFGSRSYRFTGWHLIMSAILLCAIPQILYLLSRNIELVWHGPSAKGFRIHWDEFMHGSAVNCGLKGNEACRMVSPASIPKGALGTNPAGRLFLGFEPVIQGLVWALALGTLLHHNWRERRVKRLYFLAAWFMAAIATMGKGPAGIVLPAAATGLYLASRMRWREILSLEVWSGVLILGCVAAPWFVAMYVRHGSPFTDRLFFHDMFNRAFGHVHDTNEGDDTSFRFYIWQLGYATFPWAGLAPLALTRWMRRPDGDAEGKGDTSVFLALWFALAFGLFSFMGTKFHHYIFPAVPPIAMLVGIVLDDLLGKLPTFRFSKFAIETLALVIAMGLVIAGISRLWPGSIWGTKAAVAPGEGTGLLAANTTTALTVAGLGCAIALAWMWIHARSHEPDAPPPLAEEETASGKQASEETSAGTGKLHDDLMLGAGTLAALGITLLICRDLTWQPDGTDQPGYIRFLQLFTYNYRRPWPVESLDFRAIMLALCLVCAALLVLLSIKRVRTEATILFSVFALVFAVWGIDVYMVKVSPHWGQHEVIQAYYRDRATPDEPLVAYQMNWKGENFYTSNRIPAFVSSGADFTTWVKQQKEKGVKVMYFVTEHSRTGGLKSELGTIRSFKELTDRRVCNKFVMSKVEL